MTFVCVRRVSRRLRERDGRIRSVPLPFHRRPRPSLPAFVSPRKTRPLWTEETIHWTCGSATMTGWAGSIRTDLVELLLAVLADPVGVEDFEVRIVLLGSLFRDPLEALLQRHPEDTLALRPVGQR